MTDLPDLLIGFSVPQAFTADAVAAAPATAGVHVVLHDGVVIYIGSTRDLRRRLRQHLTGNRSSSVLHDQVGQMLDTRDHAVSGPEIAQWLGGCTASWRETDNPEAEKEILVVALQPRFNRRVPKQRG